MSNCLTILSLIASGVSIILAIISIVLTIKINQDTSKTLEEIRRIATNNGERIGYAEETLKDI